MQTVESEPISQAECWQLLSTVSLGRLALSLAALPTILPVQYYVDGDELAICLGHYDVSPRSLDDTVVAFATDMIDPSSRAGWTVQVQGRTTLPRPVGVPTDCGQPTGGQIVHLAPAMVSGHRVQLCPFTVV